MPFPQPPVEKKKVTVGSVVEGVPVVTVPGTSENKYKGLGHFFATPTQAIQVYSTEKPLEPVAVPDPIPVDKSQQPITSTPTKTNKFQDLGPFLQIKSIMN